MLNVRNYISSPYVMSQEEGRCLYEEVSRTIRLEGTIRLDFSGIERATTLFFFESLCRIAVELGLDKYRENVKIHNMSDLVKVIYIRALNLTLQKAGAGDAVMEHTDMNQKRQQMAASLIGIISADKTLRDARDAKVHQ